MKPEHILQELIELAEKLEVEVSEKNLRIAGINVKSGLCRVRGRQVFILDKHMSLSKKIDALAGTLATMAHDNLYLLPAIRELIETYRPERDSDDSGVDSGGASG